MISQTYRHPGFPEVQLSRGKTRFKGRFRARRGIDLLARLEERQKSSKYTQLIFFDSQTGTEPARKAETWRPVVEESQRWDLDSMLPREAHN
jgi:hypothetical protein